MADRRLQVFHAVARLLSFTKAAEVLHMTQPAVTFQIRQLEDQFDTRLFDRTHNRVSLTEAGKITFEYSERIFEQYSEMENAIREMTNDISGSLTIGASTTISEYMLPSLLGEFNSKNPDVQTCVCVFPIPKALCQWWKTTSLIWVLSKAWSTTKTC